MSALMLPEASDSNLLREYSKGDPGAFEVFYDRHASGLYQFICALVSDSDLAGDVLQDLFRQIIRRRDDLIAAKDLRSYMFRMAHNMAVTALRAQAKRHNRIKSDSEILNLFQLEARDDSGFWNKEDLHKLCFALEKLDEADKGIVILRIYENLSFNQIGEVLGMHPKAVSRGYESALTRLKGYMEKWEGKK